MKMALEYCDSGPRQTFNCDVGCWSAKETIVFKQTPKFRLIVLNLFVKQNQF